MVPFESLDTVSNSHSIATMAVSVAVSTQHTNVTDTGETAHDSACTARQKNDNSDQHYMVIISSVSALYDHIK